MTLRCMGHPSMFLLTFNISAFACVSSTHVRLQGIHIIRTRPYEFAVAALVSFLVNLFCYLAIKYVSATSFKVAGSHHEAVWTWASLQLSCVFHVWWPACMQGV
jgi:hypothetical protein